MPGNRGRDAIHIAVICAAVFEPLSPGDRVLFSGDCAVKCRFADAVGVVDPFLPSTVDSGFVWVFMNPGSVQGLAHTWEHPSVPAASKTKKPILR